MEGRGSRRWQRVLMLRFLTMAVSYLFFTFSNVAAADYSSPHKQLGNLVERHKSTLLPEVKILEREKNGKVVIDNGLVQVTFSSPEGDVIGLKYNGIDNLLEIHNKDDNRGYWDVVWNHPNKSGSIDRVIGTRFRVIKDTNDELEISFTKTWNPPIDVNRHHSSSASSAPLNVDKRYILRRGQTGFYAYAIMERLDGWPQIDIDQIRIVFKLQRKKFHYMALSDDRQRIMPMPEDRNNGRRLDYREAVLLTKPSNPALKGEVDDKYQYSIENEDNKLHGWTSSNPPVGFWMITPSDEFRMAGPNKQDLTSHVGPTTLSMFVSTHYAGKEVGMRFEKGEAWKKVFGPVFVYLNSVQSHNESSRSLWEDAKQQMGMEVNSWPYSFAASEDFPSSDQRGIVSGQLRVFDRYASKNLSWADSAYVGLAAPGEAGSWQRESKGYQFWTRANNTGYFSIQNIRPGNYSLYAWVPGVIGDYRYDSIITITPGSNIQLSSLIFYPPRQGPTLWEIGIPDRKAAEFFIPDPPPTLINRLYNNLNTDKFRQYGLWERYTQLFPTEDLVFNVGTDDYRRNWFFAHVTRDVGNMTYESTTWQIRFRLEGLMKGKGDYTLQLALASATESVIQVRFNEFGARPAYFSTGRIGGDNAIARHGIHGLYWLFSISVSSDVLVEGDNVIYLRQAKEGSPFLGVMYDYIRLEGPSLE